MQPFNFWASVDLNAFLTLCGVSREQALEQAGIVQLTTDLRVPVAFLSRKKNEPYRDQSGQLMLLNWLE